MSVAEESSERLNLCHVGQKSALRFLLPPCPAVGMLL